jgi:hypothetical protein
MQAHLDALLREARALEGVWEGDFVAEYPHELPSFDELTRLLGRIRLKTREEALRDALHLNGLPPVGPDGEETTWMDGHLGVLFVRINDEVTIGIDWGINEQWQLVLYLDANQENFLALTPGMETQPTNDMDVERVCELVLPLVMALRGEGVTV